MKIIMPSVLSLLWQEKEEQTVLGHGEVLRQDHYLSEDLDRCREGIPDGAKEKEKPS